MIISNVTIQAYKSIQNLSLPLDSKVTVLIGPNESGKTNILRSIENFKSDIDLDADKACQYSKSYHEGKPPIIGFEITGFTKEEKTKLSRHFESFRNIDSFILQRHGPKLSDYKLIANDKQIAIGSIKPILDLLPKIIYFDTISVIKDCISLEDLQRNSASSRTENNLLKIGNIKDPALVFEDSTKGRRAAEETGREITRRIQEVWTQEPSLEIKLRVNGKLLYIDFTDSTTVYDTPKSRSPGFLWYLSFYINFIAETNEAKNNAYFFLFDEPGVHLHPSGQKDLTQLLDNMSNKNQLVYTTHSPFMINRNHPDRVRVVEKKENGTIVQNDAYRENWRPLRQSIGLTVGDLFFFSNKSIVLDLPQKNSSFFKKTK